MEPIRWRVANVVDAHSHYRGDEPIPHYLENLAAAGHAQAVILTCRGNAREDGGGIYRFTPEFRSVPQAGRFYIFGGLQHEPERIARGDGRDFPRQVDALLAAGFDGIKMMEGSPYWKTWLPHPLDHAYFRPFWARAEERQVPITLHLANPINNWLSDAPADRVMYRDAEPQEEYFRQAEAVLDAHPRLRITFAHFMFMGPQLDRLGRLFARYPEMRVDLAMGQEYMYYLSDDVPKARQFFIQWAERILYGTDVNDRNSTRLARAKADQVRLFLETDESFTSQTALAMNQPPPVESNGRSELHGLNLPQPVLEKILRNNALQLLEKKRLGGVGRR